MWFLILLCILVVLYRNDIAFGAVHVYDNFHRSFMKFKPVPPQVEDFLVFAGSCAFFLSRTKDLRKHSLGHDKNRTLLLTASIGIVLGLFLDIND